jgi:peroxiredoxin (alkyl hydroperoxide reductase subunit C)
LPASDGRLVRLRDFRGKNVVLVFYPADYSPACTGELALFQETLEDIRSHGAEVLAISTDSTFAHRAWAEQQHLGFPLLSDFWPHGGVARRYGVFLERSGTSNHALFVIDGRGVIRETWVAEDPAIAPGVGIVLAALQEIGESDVTTPGEISSHPDARREAFMPTEPVALAPVGDQHV